MDLNAIKTETVKTEDLGEEFHTEMAIEYSDNTDDFMADYYEHNQSAGRERFDLILFLWNKFIPCSQVTLPNIKYRILQMRNK